MVNKSFEATEGLLKDVMRKQAGSVEKAILEAVMNSVDARATEINLVIEDDVIVIEDDGKGMTGEEVEEYFQKFGLKDEDIEEKDFGKFRMGRGQIFNFGENFWHSLYNLMVVDLDHEYTYLPRDLLGDYEEEEVDGYEGEKVVLKNENQPSYHLLNASSTYDGCRITVKLYKQLDSVNNTVSEVKKLIKYIPWLHNVEIKINGEEFFEELEPDFETDLAYYTIGDKTYSSQTRIYNQGAYVKKESLTQTSGQIISKRDLDVNFSRNDILDTDEMYKSMIEEYELFTVTNLTGRPDSLREREKQWLLQKAQEDPQVYGDVRHMPLLSDVENRQLSISDIDGEEVSKISFSRKGNKQAQAAMENTDTIILEDSSRDAVEGLVDSGSIVELTDLIEKDMKWEMQEYPYSDLSKSRRENFDRAEWLLRQVGFDGEVKTGHSDYADVWKTEEGTLYIDKTYLKANKMEFVLVCIPHIIEIAAQQNDTRYGLSHGLGFKRDYWNYSENMGQYQKQILENNWRSD